MNLQKKPFIRVKGNEILELHNSETDQRWHQLSVHLQVCSYKARKYSFSLSDEFCKSISNKPMKVASLSNFPQS